MKSSYFLTAACALALPLAAAPPAALAAQRPVEPGDPAHPSARVARTSIIHAGSFLSAPGEKVRSRATLVIENGKVKSIHDGFADAGALGLPASTPVLDLTTKFVLPGFIDLHVHLATGGVAGRFAGLQLRQGPEFYALNAYNNAYATLMAGFTTVRDLGSPGQSVIALRDAVKLGVVAGPKIVASGEGISPTNGHGDVHGLRPDLMEAQVRPGVCDGADDCRRAVRNAIKYGADVIKVHVTGGVMDESASGTNQQFSDAEIKAIAETAHSMGVKVTTHAHGKDGIDSAVRAGFDSIEHGMWADEESLRLMKQKGTWLIPTVWPISWVGDTPEEKLRGPFKNLPPTTMEKFMKLGDQPKKLIRMAVRIGTPVALGTDNGIAPHGTNAQEFLEYVEAGMSPVEALKTGTVNAAIAGGLTDRGRLAPGFAADIVALDGDPTANIAAVTDVSFVMRDGIVFKQNGAEVRE
jgi:imidazolonepropionase-like amidohydrolase